MAFPNEFAAEPEKFVFLDIQINIFMVLVLKKGASKQRMSAILKKLQTKKGVDTKKYCGTIKLKQDALVIQKQLRDEWE